MLDFIQENEMVFTNLQISFDQDDKKVYSNIIKNWKDLTHQECLSKYTNKKQGDFFLIKCNTNFIIFDTDTEEDYKTLKSKLKSLGLYDKDSITPSTRSNEYKYKNHFWFSVEDDQFKKMKKHKLGSMEVFIGDNCNIAEWKTTELKNIKNLSYNDYKHITMEFLNTINEEPVIIKNPIQNSSKDPLFRILNNLDKKRFDQYNYWIILYFIFVNEKINLKIFDEYSKQSKKYNKILNDRILSSTKPKTGYTINTLYFWLKEDNYPIFRELSKSNKDFWGLILNNKNVADFYYQLDPTSYVYTYSNGWYEYDDNNILIHRGDKPLSLMVKIPEILQSYATEQRNLLTPSDDDYKINMSTYNKFYIKVGQTDFIKNTIQILKSLYLLDIEKELNNINLIAFNNKVYDYETNKYRNIRKSDFITKTTNYDFDKNLLDDETKEKVYNFIYTLFEDKLLVEYWFKITGLSLFGNDKQQKFYMFNGKGSNGKSLTQKLISTALGDYYKSVSNNFLVGSIKKGGADVELAGCQGIRYLSVSEPDDQDNKKFNISNLKNWSGGDKLQARGLYEKKMVEFYPQFTIFINCNDLPELSNTDDGIKRRLRNIFFPFQFKEGSEIHKNKNYRLLNNNLCDDIVKHKFIVNFIDMLIQYAYKNKNCIIDTPQSVLIASNAYCDDNNPISEWFEQTYTKINDDIPLHRYTASQLMTEYNNSIYCTKKLSSKKFFSYMEKLDIESIKPKNIRTYIKIKPLEIIEANELDN